jgi:AraC family transcriptional regulator
MRVRKVISARFSEALNLSLIAAAVGCSPFHLHRMFKLATGTTIHQHLLRVRLRHALERVLETRQPLATVALEVGFASQSHLGDSFRSEFGMSPGALRLDDVMAERRAQSAQRLLRSRIS